MECVEERVVIGGRRRGKGVVREKVYGRGRDWDRGDGMRGGRREGEVSRFVV